MCKAIVLMGVSGSGKSSIGRRLSEETGWPFFDGDGFHPPENVKKMAGGEPLNDRDRLPWLRRLNELIEEYLEQGLSLILACSALKASYREILVEGYADRVRFVFLKGDFDLIHQRMLSRANHYMDAEMFGSQFEVLEEPTDALVIDVDQRVDEITKLILAAYA